MFGSACPDVAYACKSMMGMPSVQQIAQGLGKAAELSNFSEGAVLVQQEVGKGRGGGEDCSVVRTYMLQWYSALLK